MLPSLLNFLLMNHLFGALFSLFLTKNVDILQRLSLLVYSFPLTTALRQLFDQKRMIYADDKTARRSCGFVSMRIQNPIQGQTL